MARDLYELTEEEFALWEPVQDVFQFVSAARPHTCLDIIKARVRSGTLRMAVRRLVELDPSGDPVGEQVRRIIIPGWIDKADARFWDIGDHSVKVRRSQTGYAGMLVTAEIEGARFDPEGTDGIRRDLGIPLKHEPIPILPPELRQISKAPPPITPVVGSNNVTTRAPSLDTRRKEAALDAVFGLRPMLTSGETAVHVSSLPGGWNNPELQAVFGPLSAPPPPAQTIDQDLIGRIAEAVAERMKPVEPELRENVPKNVPPDVTKAVTASEFDGWYAAQPPEIQLWGGAKLRGKCSQDHGGRRVVKKATDDITRGRTTGRKPGSKNVPR